MRRCWCSSRTGRRRGWRCGWAGGVVGGGGFMAAPGGSRRCAGQMRWDAAAARIMVSGVVAAGWRPTAAEVCLLIPLVPLVQQQHCDKAQCVVERLTKAKAGGLARHPAVPQRAVLGKGLPGKTKTERHILSATSGAGGLAAAGLAAMVPCSGRPTWCNGRRAAQLRRASHAVIQTARQRLAALTSSTSRSGMPAKSSARELQWRVRERAHELCQCSVTDRNQQCNGSCQPQQRRPCSPGGRLPTHSLAGADMVPSLACGTDRAGCSSAQAAGPAASGGVANGSGLGRLADQVTQHQLLDYWQHAGRQSGAVPRQMRMPASPGRQEAALGCTANVQRRSTHRWHEYPASARTACGSRPSSRSSSRPPVCAAADECGSAQQGLAEAIGYARQSS